MYDLNPSWGLYSTELKKTFLMRYMPVNHEMVVSEILKVNLMT